MIFLQNIVLGIFDINFGTLQEPIPLWVVLVGIAVAAIVTVFVAFLRWGKNLVTVVEYVESRRTNSSLRKEQKEMTKTIKDKFYESRLQINKSAGFDVLPYDMEIRWRNKSDVKSFLLKNAKVIIVMRDSEDHVENFTKAIEAYVEKSLIPRTRKYIPREVMLAVELTIAKKIITIEYDSALGYFDENVYKPAINTNQNLNIFTEALSTLDFRGLFTRVFLRELYDFGLRLHPQLSNNAIKEEGNKFMGFFTGIARRPEGDREIDTVFEEKHLSVAIAYIAGARSDKEVDNMILNISSCTYAQYIDSLLNRHIDTIYLLARNNKFIQLTRALLNYYSKNDQVRSTDELSFEDYSKKTPALVGRIRMRSEHH